MKTQCRPLAPALLAAAHPGGTLARAHMQAVYERCLAHYRSTQDNEDIGQAIVHFVAACLHALHHVPVTRAALQRLEGQLAHVARRAWTNTDARSRQIHFEKLAILAVLIDQTTAQARQQGVDALANVQRAARGYLRELLDLDPDHLTLGREGLALRAA